MKKKGFTLIELLVVIAIIGVLATIVISSLGSARKKAKDAKTITEVRTLKTALELYYIDHNAYPLIPIADPLAYDMVAFCTNPADDPAGAGGPALLAALKPYIGGKLEIDSCIWYSAQGSSVNIQGYGTAGACDFPNFADGQGYLILYNLKTKIIPKDFWQTYPEGSGFFTGNIHCNTNLDQ